MLYVHIIGHFLESRAIKGSKTMQPSNLPDTVSDGVWEFEKKIGLSTVQ